MSRWNIDGQILKKRILDWTVTEGEVFEGDASVQPQRPFRRFFVLRLVLDRIRRGGCAQDIIKTAQIAVDFLDFIGSIDQFLDGILKTGHERRKRDKSADGHAAVNHGSSTQKIDGDRAQRIEQYWHDTQSLRGSLQVLHAVYSLRVAP